MSDYFDILSAYNNVSSIGSLSGVSTKTGLEGLAELGGQDEGSDFMSVLASYMNTSQANPVDDVISDVMADKLSDVMADMDEQSDSYKTIQEVYEYLSGSNSVSSVLSNLYGTGAAKEVTSSDMSEQSETVQSFEDNAMTAINPIVESDIEGGIESMITNSINLSGLPE